jgi:transposase
MPHHKSHQSRPSLSPSPRPKRVPWTRSYPKTRCRSAGRRRRRPRSSQVRGRADGCGSAIGVEGLMSVASVCRTLNAAAVARTNRPTTLITLQLRHYVRRPSPNERHQIRPPHAAILNLPQDSRKKLSRKRAGGRDAIEAVGATLMYLPPYSADLNPIEQTHSKWKWLLKSTNRESAAIACLSHQLAVPAGRRQRVGRDRLNTPGIVLTARTEFVRSSVRDGRGRKETDRFARSKP